MQGDDALKEGCLGHRDVLDRLAGHRIGQEADEIAGMPRFQRHADLAVGLEAADARAMPGARVHHHEGAFYRVDHHALGRLDAHQKIIHRSRQGAPVTDQIRLEAQHVRHGFRIVRCRLFGSLAHHVHEQHGALTGVRRIG